MEFILQIVILIVGVIIGLLIRVAIDPILKKREREQVRKEALLEKALDHSKEVLRHIQATRSVAVSHFGFSDPGQIEAAIVMSLTPGEYGPEKLDIIRSIGDVDSKSLLKNVEESFMAVRVAAMDIDNGATPASPEYEPTNAIQRYTTQIKNLRDSLEKLLRIKR
jgi:hypothetical protein